MRVNRFFAGLALCALIAAAALGQTAPSKKTYTFHGKVEAVDTGTNSLKVNGEEVKGWMSAMTMDYKVDDAAVLKKVKPGDQISATVYEGDLVLHKVQVTPNPPADSKAKK
jgi:Cu/Ag efflux protein CusF